MPPDGAGGLDIVYAQRQIIIRTSEAGKINV